MHQADGARSRKASSRAFGVRQRGTTSLARSTRDCVVGKIFQIRAVVSADAVTTRVPSGLNVAPYTGPSWPLSTAIVASVAASQTRAVLSMEAVTIRLPS